MPPSCLRGPRHPQQTSQKGSSWIRPSISRALRYIYIALRTNWLKLICSFVSYLRKSCPRCLQTEHLDWLENKLTNDQLHEHLKTNAKAFTKTVSNLNKA